jgi:hypothetical protein
MQGLASKNIIPELCLIDRILDSTTRAKAPESTSGAFCRMKFLVFLQVNHGFRRIMQ